LSVTAEGLSESPRPVGRLAIWRRDRGLLALLVLFVVLAPLVTQRIYASDEIQYFAYTHSLFFDQDFDFTNQYQYYCTADPVKFANFCRDLLGKKEPLTGLPLNVAPIGTGLLWMPFFALAHAGVLIARALGATVPADGFSQPYISAICFASYLFACIGLLLCYSLARRYFGQGVAALAVITMWLATPLIFYTVIAPPWSHATSLMAVTLFIWLWARTRRPEGRTLREWVLLGASAGLMMLVREQDALFMAVPGVEALASVVGGLRTTRAGASDPSGVARAPSQWPAIWRWALGPAVMGLVAAAVFIPQLIAYRAITGRFRPSQVVSGKFTWTSPNFFNVLFNPEHGLFLWTPVYIVGVLGLILLWRRDRLLTGALALTLLLQVYITGSFLTWQSASSFGQRRFINSTSVFVLGFAALAAWVLANGWPRWLVVGVAALFVAWNAGLLMQYALWCSAQRQGLDWGTVIRGQLEMPGRAFRLLWDYLFNRQVFYRRTRDC
jgi:hypothetical protein